MATPHQILSDRFGLERFRPGQEEVIDHLLAGRSAAACFPTGGGKSLCYQLPALLLPGLTLVVSPLLALMKEQIDRLQKLEIAAERLDSTCEVSDLTRITQALRAGKLQLLYVAPERFNNERFRAQLQGVRLSLFAVDEAHCISEWGHNFRPDYLKLANFAKRYGAERMLALTATATPQVIDDICKGFGIGPECVVRTGFHRSNLSLHTTPVEPQRRDALLIERLKKVGPGASIVYVTLQKTAEQVAERLEKAGLPAKAYHAGMETEDRVRVQEWFASSPHAIVAATIAFGMGIDKADIRAVYHYNLPKSLENWSQEIGRAGRDGQPAHCELLASPEDMIPLENFVYGDTPSASAVRSMVQEIFRLGTEFDVSLYELAGDHDIRPLVLNTLLTYLELDGYLEAETPVFSAYKFQPLASFPEILQRFDAQRQTFLNELFQLATRAKTWYSLDLERAMQATNSPRDRILRALDYLKEKGLMQVEAENTRHRYRRLRQPDDLNALAGELLYRTREREQREIRRLHQVLEVIEHDGCQTSRLGQHFGEALAHPCGRCSWCLTGRKPMRLPARVCPPIPADLARQLTPLWEQHAEVLCDPRTLTRFLCGLTSPRLTRAKLGKEKLFGALDEVPFARVLAWAETLA